MRKLWIVAAMPLLFNFRSGPAWAQEDPFQALRQYDFQHRQALNSISKMVRDAGPDRARRSAIETGLIGVLSDESAKFAGKQEACKFLMQVGSSKCVPALDKLLPDSRLGDAARFALERNFTLDADRALHAALQTAKGPVLVGIINSIGNRSDRRAVSLLKPFTASADPTVSEAAIAALGKIGSASAFAILSALPGKGLEKSTALLHCADSLYSDGFQSNALHILEVLSEPGAPTITRIGALNLLAGYRSPRTASIALSFAQSMGDLDLQRSGARTLGRLTAPADVQRAITAFPRLPNAAKVALLSAWAERREPAASRLALSALKSPEEDVRRAGIRASVTLGGAAAVLPLSEIAAGGADAAIARESLARISGPGVETALIAQANQGSPEVRIALITVLVERATAPAKGVMLRAARDSNIRISAAGLKSLGKTGGLSDVAELVRILVAAQSDEVREGAQTAIVAIAQRAGDRNRASEPLLANIGSAAPAVRVALIRALAEVGGDRALDEIIKASSSSDDTVRSAAVAALADTWADSRPLPSLIQIARVDPSKSLRIQALRGYLRLTDQDNGAPSEQRINRVKEALSAAERPEEKRQALSVLRGIRAPGAVDIAAKALDDPSLTADAADTILYLAAPQKRGNTNLAAVKGASTDIALDKVIRVVQDSDVREKARKLRTAS